MAGVALHALWAPTGAERGPEASVAAARLERDVDVDPQVVSSVESGVMWVEASGCGVVRQASATVVRHGSRDVMLTNAHVVVGSGTVSVRTTDGRVVSTEVVGTVPGRDAALLEVPEGVTALPVGAMPGRGDELIVAGHPDGTARAVGGRVAGIERRVAHGVSSEVLLVDVAVTGGNSGGAVLDARGAVVGLVAAKDPRTGWAVAYPIAEVVGRGLGPIPAC